MVLKTAVALSVWVHRILVRCGDGGELRSDYARVGVDDDERRRCVGEFTVTELW